MHFLVKNSRVMKMSSRGWRSTTTLLYSLLLVGCAGSQNTLRINDVAVYQNLGGVGDTAQRRFEEAGLGRVYVIYQQHFVTPDGLVLDEARLRERISKIIPDEKSKDIIVLDWEGDRMKQLLRGATTRSQQYEEAKVNFVRAYRTVKSMRPNTTVGFYGFPERNYWKRNEEWRTRNDSLMDFLKATDALFPSIYDFYRTTDKNREQELAYARENTQEALRMGAALGIPVYPFVWHRYHESNKELKRQLIPEAEFQEHVNAVVNTTWEGRKVEGIVWWSSEQYFYNLTKKRAGGDKVTFEEVVTRPTLLYFETLQRALREQ